MFEEFSEKSGPRADIINREPARRLIDPECVFDKGAFAGSRINGFTRDGLFGLDPEDKAQPKTKALLRLDDKPSINNLTTVRLRKQTLPPDEEARLILAAQAGDMRAADRLVRAHLPWVQVQAFGKWGKLHPPRNSNDERGVTLEDFVASGLQALLHSIPGWRPGLAFNTYYRKAVRGAITEAAADWRNRGIKAETRIQRLIRAHPDWCADWLHEDFRKRYPGANDVPSLDEIEAEKAIAFTLWWPTKYDEASTFDDAGDHDKDGNYKGGDETQFTGPVRGYEGGPVSEWSRSQARNGLHPSRKFDHPNDWVTGKRSSGSIWSDRKLQDRDRRAITAIGWMGRRGYADLLVRRELKRRKRPKLDEVPAPSFRVDTPIRQVVQRHVPPLPGPGQASGVASYYNLAAPSKWMCRSLNIEPAAIFTPPTNQNPPIQDILPCQNQKPIGESTQAPTSGTMSRELPEMKRAA